MSCNSSCKKPSLRSLDFRDGSFATSGFICVSAKKELCFYVKRSMILLRLSGSALRSCSPILWSKKISVSTSSSRKLCNRWVTIAKTACAVMLSKRKKCKKQFRMFLHLSLLYCVAWASSKASQRRCTIYAKKFAPCNLCIADTKTQFTESKPVICCCWLATKERKISA